MGRNPPREANTRFVTCDSPKRPSTLAQRGCTRGGTMKGIVCGRSDN